MQKNQISNTYDVTEYGNKTATTIVFFFCPFSVPSWQLALPGLPIWRLTKAGYRVVAYSYHLAIATSSPGYTLAAIQSLLSDADKRVDRYGQNIQIFCYGTSMGTVFATNLAARHSRIDKVVLNLCYSDITEHVLALPPLFLIQPKRLANYIAAGGGPTGLRHLFDQYSPLYLVDRLAGKEILLYLARNDRLHQYKHTLKLLQVLRETTGIKLEYSENAYLGHYFAALKNHLVGHRYMNFLDKQKRDF